MNNAEGGTPTYTGRSSLARNDLGRDSSGHAGGTGGNSGGTLSSALIAFGDASGLRADRRVKFDPDTGCWRWIGATRSGYGAAKVGGKVIGVHRAALALRLGRDLAAGMDACHICDRRECVNPDHIFEGSRSSNMRDAAAKGRLDKALNDADVRRIREAFEAGQSKKSLAEAYGVSRDTILCALRSDRGRRSA